VAVITDALSEATAQALGTPSAPGNPGPVMTALRALGYDPVMVEFDGDASGWLGELTTGRFQLVFNLCEGLGNQTAGEPVAAALVELLGIPLTGGSSDMLGLCLRKDRANAVLRAHGIPVPEWIVARPDARRPRWRRFPAIVKPAAEDGSFGIGSDSVVGDPAALEAVVRRGCQQWGRMIVQRFVNGREFNLAIVGGRVLPHAEIDFSRLRPGLPAVVTYSAKWEHGSPEDRGTVPRCPARLPRRASDPAGRAGLGCRGRHRIRPHRRPGRRPGYDVRHRREPESGPRRPGGIGPPGGRRGVELPRPDRPDRRGRPRPRAWGRRSGPDSSDGARGRSAPDGGHAVHPAPRAGHGPA
jgi:D-alanine-D-alanine ligase-like ATP-grasp enzyme